MRKVVLVFTKVMIGMSIVLTSISCSKDDENSNTTPIEVTDPTGTITANIAENVDIQIHNSELSISGTIGWCSPDNFDLEAGYQVSICDMGSLPGLGSVTEIPATGFTVLVKHNKSVACEQGHGYVVHFYNYNTMTSEYVRLYVVEPIISTAGGIMGAKVKYQTPFNP